MVECAVLGKTQPNAPASLRCFVAEAVAGLPPSTAPTTNLKKNYTKNNPKKNVLFSGLFLIKFDAVLEESIRLRLFLNSVCA